MPNFSINSFNASNTMLSSIESPSYNAFINSLVKNSDVILLNADTAMKGAAFEAMIRTLIPSLQQYGKVITVLQPVMAELRYRAASVDPKVKEKAVQALADIQALEQAGVVRFKGNPNKETTGSASIIRYVLERIWLENVTILSQDARLAGDCKLFSQIKSTKLEHTVQIKRISTLQGQLNNFNDTPVTPQQSTRPAATSNAASILSRFGI